MVVDAEAAADVEVLGLEAFGADLLDKSNHDLRGVPEDVHLCDGGPQVAMHSRQLQQRLFPYSVQEPLRTT